MRIALACLVVAAAALAVSTDLSPFSFQYRAAASGVRVHAQQAPFELVEGGGDQTTKRSAAACCKNCVCQASVVAECQCMDVKPYICEKSCKSCRCTKSIPPRCSCLDYHRDDCYPPACRS